MEKINVKSIVKRELQKRYLNQAELARKLHLSQTTVYGMLTRPTLQVQRLIDLSLVCNYNFFREIADQLPCAEPPVAVDESAKADNIRLGERINVLESEIKRMMMELEMSRREVDMLRQTLRDLSGK